MLYPYRFLTAVPTAELEPLTETYVQADEVSMYCTRPAGLISCRSPLTRFTGISLTRVRTHTKD